MQIISRLIKRKIANGYMTRNNYHTMLEKHKDYILSKETENYIKSNCIKVTGISLMRYNTKTFNYQFDYDLWITSLKGRKENPGLDQNIHIQLASIESWVQYLCNERLNSEIYIEELLLQVFYDSRFVKESLALIDYISCESEKRIITSPSFIENYTYNW